MEDNESEIERLKLKCNALMKQCNEQNASRAKDITLITNLSSLNNDQKKEIEQLWNKMKEITGYEDIRNIFHIRERLEYKNHNLVTELMKVAGKNKHLHMIIDSLLVEKAKVILDYEDEIEKIVSSYEDRLKNIENNHRVIVDGRLKLKLGSDDASEAEIQKLYEPYVKDKRSKSVVGNHYADVSDDDDNGIPDEYYDDYYE